MADNRGALTKTTIEKEKNTRTDWRPKWNFWANEIGICKGGIEANVGAVETQEGSTSVGVNLFSKVSTILLTN